MDLIVRTSVRVLLFNEEGALLLLCADDPKTTTSEGKYHGRFWFPVGGEMESGESIEETALREIYEETGLSAEDIQLGPVVWYGEFDFVLSGVPTRCKQKFIVARTTQSSVNLSNLTQEERGVIEKIAWFTLQQIQDSEEVIYPVVLADHLPPIIASEYPSEPIEIDLAKQP